MSSSNRKRSAYSSPEAGCRPYAPDPATREFHVWDEVEGGRHSRPPAFQGGGGGLVSTADDYHACSPRSARPSPDPVHVFLDFWTTVHQAIGD